MEKKKIQVIRLATKSKTGMLWETTSGQLMHTHTSGIFRETYTPFHLYFVNDEEIKEGDYCYYLNSLGGGNIICQAYKHKDDRRMLFDSGDCNRTIGEGITPLKGECKKIIATTDPLLNIEYINEELPTNPVAHFRYLIPQPSQAFIEEYCKQGGIDWVDVEYEVEYEVELINKARLATQRDKNGQSNCKVSSTFKLKVNSNNEIITHSIKDSWSRDEVESLIRDCFGDECTSNNWDIKAEDWIKENL